MLLTLTTTHRPATDLGFLLRKNPANTHAQKLPFGMAHVVWPEASEARATAALILEIDPISLVRGRAGSDRDGPLAQYVNDRPYVGSSLMSVAIARVFRNALNGQSKDRPELVDTAMPLEVRLEVLRCRGGEPFLRSLFEPLGYTVDARRLPRDETHPEWGDSSLFSVSLSHTIPLKTLLRHLYVLIPVLDDDKHYWVGDDEVSKLLAKGQDWLATHPAHEAIALRYLKRSKHLARKAVERLVPQAPEPDEPDTPGSTGERALERPLSLNARRLDRVVELLVAAGAHTVVDLGCGEGKLVRRLLGLRRFTKVIGMDVSPACLERAERRLKLDRAPTTWAERVQLIQGSATYRDDRLQGLDAAALVEVIEHMELDRLPALEDAVFGHAAPRTVLVSTPNVEYNQLFAGLPAGRMRHADHRWEWDRSTFEAWARGVAERHAYTVQFHPIGDVHPEHGAPTQLAEFRR